MEELVRPLPPPTTPGGPRPDYFTCRHGYEGALMDEIRRRRRRVVSGREEAVMTMSPYPGLVRVEDHGGGDDDDDSYCDPAYALQSMPHCVVVEAESARGIARGVLAALLGDISSEGGDSIGIATDDRSERQRRALRAAERGSLTIHPLVPGMCKGQANPVMLRRSERIGEELSGMLKRAFPAARRRVATAGTGDDDVGAGTRPEARWALQVMLQGTDVAVASLAECVRVGPPGIDSYWPNVNHPLGLARVDIEERMPSSAYRKLMEGMECMGVRPSMEGGTTSTVIDLGACPGGWTAVARWRLGCRVIAVDRTELDPALMEDAMVEFVRGDAFAYEPPQDLLSGEEGGGDVWMISDVIAYPDRATELLDRWCGNGWASAMIVTMKFQGDEPNFDEVDRAIQVVRGHRYCCRVKHFFNNKNEVTFMVWKDNDARAWTRLEAGVLGAQMYPSL